MDLNTIGTSIGAIALGIITYWGQYAVLKHKKKAQVAEYSAEQSTFEAESRLYKHLKERIEELEKSTVQLRRDLDAERNRGRNLEIHIWKLENMMRKAGLEPPPFDLFPTVLRAESTATGAEH